MNIQETEVIEELAQASRYLMRAKKLTGNGLVDDHCCNALKEIQAALNIAVNDSADEE